MAKLVGGEQFSIITDHLGTPVLMADVRGNRVWSAQISVFGELRELDGERYACPFRWPGQYEDAETGLYYNRFRYYDPEAGQYCSQDPIGLAGGGNVVAYPHDPLMWADPLGLKSCRKDKTHVFWSGGGNPRVKTEAERWAREHGAITLERTGSGSRLEKHAARLDWVEAEPHWKKHSKRFAKESTDEVHVFLNRAGINPKSVWHTLEKPMLEGKGVNIITHLVD